MIQRQPALRRRLQGASLSLMIAACAGAVHAADAADAAARGPAPAMTGAGAEGTDIEGVVVTAESNKAAADAPSKGSLVETQPESIISRKFIEQATPEIGNWTTAASIAPSVSGITANGGGIGEYNKLSMRGFQDGQYNLTFDGIAFGDTNDPTHHAASYFPSSTLQAVVIDRGPGAAGDLGQANFGGAIHFFSLDPADTFGVTQKLTVGSFSTVAGMTTINTGVMPQLGGAKLILNFDARNSKGELSRSGGYATNGMGKFMLPIGDKATLTVFAALEYTRFYLGDAGPGLTWQQSLLYGKDFALNNIPTDEHYYKYNYEGKSSDFEYIDLKGEVIPSVTAENQLYTYFYANKTTATNDLTGLVGGPNTSPPNITTPPQSASDIGGYDKLNEYRVVGDIVRVNKDWSFGALKAGGLIETSSTNRHNSFIDLTLKGIPDNKFQPPKFPFTTNQKLMEDSKWLQYQLFADFEWRPLENLSISPGFKYVHFRRDVNAAHENTAGGSKNQPLVGSNTYTQPLYFLTGNYRITPDWSVYAQSATSFLIPSLSALYVAGVSLQGLKPERAATYQAGAVYTHGKFTADADAYRVNVSNLVTACLVPNPTPGNAAGTTAGFCNNGDGEYTGVEGEAAYAFDFGLTVFVNGSLSSAKQLANTGDVAAGIAAGPAQGLTNAPKWTYALGGVYRTGPWAGSLTFKQSGAYVAGYNGDQAIHLSGYNSLDASIGYDFGRFTLKLQGFNLADRRAIVAFSGSTLYSTADTGLYTFQAGREIEATVVARF